jgi:molecular chaperone DnaK (HSP70)
LFKVSSEIDPDLSVSIGNSMYAGKSQIIQRTPKYLGILVNGLFKTVVSKGTILPASETVYVKNLKPWETVVDVKFYQTNSLMGVPEHISTVEVSGLQGHDEDGYVVLGVKIECLLDGTINASVKSGGKVYNAALSYVDSIQAVQEPPLIAMTRKANSKLNDEELTRLLEKWDKANDLSLLSLMNKRLVACRKK